MNEIAGSILGLTSARFVKPTILSQEQFAKAVAYGVLNANALMKRVLRGEEWVGKEKLWFGWRLVSEINKRVAHYYPGAAGLIREDDNVSAGGFRPARASQLPHLTYKFGTWLQDEVDSKLSVECPKIEDGIRIATGAHYILTHLLHPFDGGNGRTARCLVNGILAYGADEYRTFGRVVSPVPQMRQEPNDRELAERIDRGEEIEVEPYIRALREIERTGRLTPLELYIASLWEREVGDNLVSLGKTLGKRKYKSGDFLRGVYEYRLKSLQSYQARLLNGSIEDPIPNYDEIRYIRV